MYPTPYGVGIDQRLSIWRIAGKRKGTEISGKFGYEILCPSSFRNDSVQRL